MIPKRSLTKEAMYPYLVLLGGFALGLLGPFGQADRFLPVERIGLWVAYLTLGLPLLFFVRNSTDRVLRNPSWIITGLVTALITCFPLLLWVETLGLIQGRALPETASDWTWSMGEALLAALFALAVFEGYTQLRKRAYRVGAKKVEGPVVHETLNQVVRADAGKIYGFCAEGHYGRIFCETGEHFVDRPFSDLMRSAATSDGVQVHRSWWVAKGAVSSFRRIGSAGELTLLNGVKVPVARRRMTDKLVVELCQKTHQNQPLSLNHPEICS